jgi:hypothetical protein
MKKLIVLHEKHCDIYIMWSDDKIEREAIAKKIIERRGLGGYFIEEDEKIEAQKAIQENTCYRLLQKRSGYEYESYEIVSITENI